MAGASLLALLDDITSLLDDVAAMTKIATKKTAAVLSDDLALNAEQVSGVTANREIPVVWAVAKGSMLNKLFIIPVVLVISYFVPWLIKFLLIIGGIYLCFEGAEKVIHSLIKMRHPTKKDSTAIIQQQAEMLSNSHLEQISTLERQKVKGAIRTDFILSAEIMVIALNVVLEQSLLMQIGVLLTVAILITVGVYGIVAMIIKLDDLGYWLILKNKNRQLFLSLGKLLINSAPYLMRFLSIVGTIAMFLVGGGIVLHNIKPLADLEHDMISWIETTPNMGDLLSAISPTISSLILGIMIGIVSMIVLNGVKRITNR
ncbi:DUF808 domain-containing protein [Utexia brackfieldae]|uniref:DUF808 domain-containing protein n=1 Tax=Utexia brackfieldae TaxID=3074108 RepID=UPI00370DB196